MDISESQLDHILAAVREVPGEVKQDLERRYWNASRPINGEFGEVYAEPGEKPDRAALQAIERELQQLIPGYKPQIQ